MLFLAYSKKNDVVKAFVVMTSSRKDTSHRFFILISIEKMRQHLDAVLEL